MRDFTVIWWPPAEQDLTNLWIDSPDRQSIADATDRIEQELARTPLSSGKSVWEGLRSLTIDPLHVQFSVNDGDRKVTVWSVRLQ